MIRLGIYLALALAIPSLLLGLVWVIAPRRTDRSFVSAGAVRRGLRWYRSLWPRTGAAIAGWPHLIDRALGTPRAPLPATPWDVVWEDGKVRLYRIEGSPDGGIPLLVVHSLISQPWILDLTEERSLLRALRDAGFDTYLLDWGNFDVTEANNDLSHYANVLMRAEDQVLAKTGSKHIHLAGYCLGGTLCLARAAARRHDHIASIALIATPWDFAVPSPLHTVMSHPLLKPVTLLDGSSGVPGSVVREGFHLLRPQALRSVMGFVNQRKDPAFRRSYDALARWVWEHRRLPGALFFDLVDLFRNNALFEGRLEIAGELARLSDVRAPVGVFVAERDHIVPSGSSHALTSAEGLEVDMFTIPSGHVSMICGSAARDVMWPRLIEWIAKHDERPAA
jgi:polyhydroxyalkanoate synthase